MTLGQTMKKKTLRKLPTKAELVKALKLARGFIRREQIEHAIVDYSAMPQVTLGEHLDAVLRKAR
jgi:hypothetical protein